MTDGSTKARVSWNKIARRIRVPLGFLFAVFYFWRAQFIRDEDRDQEIESFGGPP